MNADFSAKRTIMGACLFSRRRKYCSGGFYDMLMDLVCTLRLFKPIKHEPVSCQIDRLGSKLTTRRFCGLGSASTSRERLVIRKREKNSGISGGGGRVGVLPYLRR